MDVFYDNLKVTHGNEKKEFFLCDIFEIAPYSIPYSTDSQRNLFGKTDLTIHKM